MISTVSDLRMRDYIAPGDISIWKLLILSLSIIVWLILRSVDVYILGLTVKNFLPSLIDFYGMNHGSISFQVNTCFQVISDHVPLILSSSSIPYFGFRLRMWTRDPDFTEVVNSC